MRTTSEKTVEVKIDKKKKMKKNEKKDFLTYLILEIKHCLK